MDTPHSPRLAFPPRHEVKRDVLRGSAVRTNRSFHRSELVGDVTEDAQILGSMHRVQNVRTREASTFRLLHRRATAHFRPTGYDRDHVVRVEVECALEVFSLSGGDVTVPRLWNRPP